MNRVRTGEIPWTILDDLHRMTLDELLPRFGMEGLTEAESVHLNKVWHRLRPWPDRPNREPPPWPEVGRFDLLVEDFHDLAAQLGIWTLPA